MPSRSDKLFRKRKALTASKLRRASPSIEPRKRVLIVCEGSITEPQYFKYLRQRASKTNIEVEICGEECGAAPISVVNFAEKRANLEGPQKEGGYDLVFCVFDRDEHADFERALSRVQSLNKAQSKFLAGAIRAICSYPCFEIWLIFHYRFTRKPYTKSGNKSSASVLIEELRSIGVFSAYKKELTNDMLDDLYEKTTVAVRNSKKASEDVRKTYAFNPSTEIHYLMDVFT